MVAFLVGFSRDAADILGATFASRYSTGRGNQNSGLSVICKGRQPEHCVLGRAQSQIEKPISQILSEDPTSRITEAAAAAAAVVEKKKAEKQPEE